MNHHPRLSLPNHHRPRFYSPGTRLPRDLAIVLLIGLGALSGVPADAQSNAGRSRPRPISDLDPERDLEVSFSTDFEKAPDAGYIFGKVTNRSASTYPCVHLEFRLFSGDGKSRASGTLGTDVNNVRPRSVTRYRARLDSPVSVALKSVTVCRQGENAPPAKPRILSFRADPPKIDPGGAWVSLYWEVKDAKQVLLYDDYGKMESRIELPNGELGWPPSMNGSQRENLHQSTKFTLVAINNAGRVSKSFQVVAAAKVCAKASVALCRRKRAGCFVVHAADGSSRDVCRWASKRSADACSSTAGIWTTKSSRYARRHPDAVPPGVAGACINEVSNLR